MTLAQTERHALADLLIELGPDAPTLNEGWTTADLAAHLWVRENDPVALPGIGVPQLAGLTRRRMDVALRRLGYPGLVRQWRGGPQAPSPLRIPKVDQLVNGLEYFVHHEDVRRAQPDATPRDLAPATEREIAQRLVSMRRMLFGGYPVGLVAQRTDDIAQPWLTLRGGDPAVVIKGRPSEILLFGFGRGEHADVDLLGRDHDVRALRAHAFSG